MARSWWSRVVRHVEGQFFVPDRAVVASPHDHGLVVEELMLPGPEGSALHAWWLPAQGTPRGTVLHLHGNAANMSVHLHQVEWLPKAGFNVLTFDYRGFGQSEGLPTLHGIVADSRAALAWLRQRQGVDAQRLVVLGQSLGGATAVRVAADDPAGIALLVLDCPFSSYRTIARDAVRGTLQQWLLPMVLPLIPGPRHDPLTAIGQLGMPVLVIHGSDDAVVPISHGKALFAAARQPKQWLEVHHTGHVDGFLQAAVREQVIAAMLAATKSPATAKLLSPTDSH